jgi:peroxin-2
MSEEATQSTSWRQSYKTFQKQQQQQNKHQNNTSDDKLRILRVNQLDSVQLDTEISYALNSYFKRIFQFFDPSLIDTFQPELNALLQLLIYKFSVYENDASFGDRIQNLKYRNSKNQLITKYQKIVHALLNIGIPWIQFRLNRLAIDQNWGEIVIEQDTSITNRLKYYIYKYSHTVEMSYKLLSLVNFIVFLKNGKYRSIADRLCGMRLVYANKLMNRQVSFDYMNRELVWSGFAEMILFIIPLINFNKVRNLLSRLIRSRTTSTAKKSSGVNQQQQQTLQENKLILSNTVCPQCQLDPIQVPYVCYPCNHVFCYYCIQNVQNMNDNSEQTLHCPFCDTEVTDCKRAQIER